MICCAVIDTNVLVSALLSSHDDAATVQVIIKLLAGEVTPLYSNEILREYRDVLRRPKFHFDTELVDCLLSAVETFGVQVIPSPTGEVLPDIKDLPFYEVVMERREDSAYLVTGNKKHFPQRRFIVTPNEFIKILDQQSPSTEDLP